MPSGKLGAVDLAANADTLLYTVPPNTVSTATIRLVNRSAATIKARLAIGAGAAPAAADYIEYDAPIPASGILEDSGIALSAGEKIWVRSDAVGISARAHGFEEAA